jgi:hypothetical protein
MNTAVSPLPAAAAASVPRLAEAFPVMAVRTRVHALKPGTFPAAPLPLTVTAADLSALAAAYDPARYRAPVVIGHPEDDHPAWGWVSEASTDDTGLWLTVDLLPEMAELIRDRRYGQVSVALWTPEAPGNPAPGAYALKHLGFLGAVPPAVKGLAPVRLSEDPARREGVAVITCEEHPMPDVTPAAPPADAVTLSEREAAIATREAALARRERELRQAQYRAEVEAHVAAGRITAAEVSGLVAVLEALNTAPTVQLSEAESIAPQDALRAHLAALPPRVTLGEHAAPDRSADDAGHRLPKVPAGYRLSEAGLDLHTRAVQYQAAHPAVDYLTAVRAVSR